MVTYKKAGVDIDKADKLVSWIKKINPSIGGFSGLFPLDGKKCKNPVLASSTDGVGTKLRIAQLVNKHDTIGIDLVAMCVNDLLTCGAKPLFFLDYFATGKLDLRLTQRVIKGIVKGCMLADCILLGGETAEMPQCYKSGEYDLAGFSVGLVEKHKSIIGSRIKPGDLIVGLESSGLHSNGFSLVQKVFSRKELKKLSNELLKPTKLYVKTLLPFINPGHSPSIIKGLVHITGGGLVDNLPRILPLNCQAVIYKDEWEVPDIFCSIREKGKVSEGEMFRVFNMGIGMVLIIPQKHGDLILKNIKKSHLIGKIVAGRRGVRLK